MRLLRRWVTVLSALAVFGAVLMVGGSVAVGAAPGTCFGMPATIFAVPGVPTVGTPGPDVIVGTPGPDNIRGKGGADKICSKAGDDTVWGGAGPDMIKLGSGADWASGGSGADSIWGKRGPDEIYGKSGMDTISGGKARDTIYGGSAKDDLEGKSGNDSIYGGGSIDTCTGGTGHRDELYSCNETAPFVGRRTNKDPFDGSFRAQTITSTGPGTYSVIGTDAASQVCGGLADRFVGTGVSSGAVLTTRGTITCSDGSTADPSATTTWSMLANGQYVAAFDGSVWG